MDPRKYITQVLMKVEFPRDKAKSILIDVHDIRGGSSQRKEELQRINIKFQLDNLDVCKNGHEKVYL